MQIDGQTTWHVFRPVVTEDDMDYWWVDRGFTQEEMAQLTLDHAIFSATLDPGDVIVVPMGLPHFFIAQDGGSMHVSLPPLPTVIFERYGNEDHLL